MTDPLAMTRRKRGIRYDGEVNWNQSPQSVGNGLGLIAIYLLLTFAEAFAALSLSPRLVARERPPTRPTIAPSVRNP